MSICTLCAVAQPKSVELPKAGDIGFGIDVVPMLEYVGNMFATGEGRVNTLSSFGGEETLQNELSILNPNASIILKYMLTDEIALRVNAGLLTRKNSDKNYQYDDKVRFEDPLAEDKVIDIRNRNRSGASFAVGGEFRKGDDRIQGFAGIDFIYGFENARDEYQYGNTITALNQTPGRTSAGTPLAVPYWTRSYVTARYNDGATRYVGFDVRMGVEYFLSNKLSIGGEVSLYGLNRSERACYQEQEGFNYLNNTVETRTELVSPGNREFTFGTDNLGGKLFMMFYF